MVTSILFASSLLLSSLSAGQPGQLSDSIASCASENDSLKRLVCYDQVASQYQLNKTSKFINPEQEFLTSKLVVTPWEPEYSLSIADFVKLLSTAVLDDGSKIKINGWTKNNDRYVLNIMMHQPVRLTFLPAKDENIQDNLSLLEPVELKGRITEAAQFVMVIATMVPDK